MIVPCVYVFPPGAVGAGISEPAPIESSRIQGPFPEIVPERVACWLAVSMTAVPLSRSMLFDRVGEPA